jgi:hypothetical protein
LKFMKNPCRVDGDRILCQGSRGLPCGNRTGTFEVRFESTREPIVAQQRK